MKIDVVMNTQKSLMRKTPLETAFNVVLDVLCDDSSSDSSHALIEVAAAILLDRTFDVDRIKRLLNEESSEICGAIIEFCLIDGMAHEDRKRFCAEFAPYFALLDAEVKH